MKYLHQVKIFIGVVVSMALLASVKGHAATFIGKGYVSNDDDLRIGMVVALSGDSDSGQQSVERASTGNKTKYIGVATQIDDSVITINNSSATVYISNSGQYQMYVSDLNGPIKKGDTLVISPLKGILMRRSDDGKNDTSVAIALSDSEQSNSDITSETIRTNDGSTKEVKVTKVDAEINTSTIIQDQQKKFFSVFGESLTGKPVSEVRVLIACIILLLVLIIEGSLLYGAVSSSITAVGRNPLSKKVVYKQLIYTSFLGLIILIVGLGGIYVVIWT